MISPGFKPPESGSAIEAIKHFGAAFVFLILGLAALVANSDAIASGGAGAVNVIAGLHLLTLGWLSLSIFGALQVFMGVALGVSPAANGLTAWTRRVWIVGVVLFPMGLAAHRAALIGSGLLALGVGLSLLTIQMAPALWRAKRGPLTRAYSIIALCSLWCAWSLGTLAGLARVGWVPLGLPPGYFVAHVLIAAFGWVGAMIGGVGSHLVPMFALSKPTTALPMKIALPLWAGVLVFGMLSAFQPDPWSRIAWSLAAGASALWIIQFTLYLLRRLRKEKDPGIVIAGFATGFLGAAWIVLVLFKTPQAFMGIIIIGWLSLFTLGIYHRVIPFLFWFYHFSTGKNRGAVPRVKDLLNERLAAATVFLSISGVSVWVTGFIAQEPFMVYGGSGCLLVGALICLGQIHPLSGEAFRKETANAASKRVPYVVADSSH